MKKIIGLIVTLFLLFSTYAPTFTEAAEVLKVLVQKSQDSCK
ncbi:hypothetical protein [Bacillus sp. FSL R12-0074]